MNERQRPMPESLADNKVLERGGVAPRPLRFVAQRRSSFQSDRVRTTGRAYPVSSSPGSDHRHLQALSTIPFARQVPASKSIRRPERAAQQAEPTRWSRWSRYQIFYSEHNMVLQEPIRTRATTEGQRRLFCKLSCSDGCSPSLASAFIIPRARLGSRQGNLTD